MATEAEPDEVRVVLVGDSAVAGGFSPSNPQIDQSPVLAETNLPRDRETLSLASLGLRVAAGVVDLLLVILATGLAGVVHLPLVYGAVFIFIAYHTSLVWLTGKTAGKALFGLKVDRSAKKWACFGHSVERQSATSWWIYLGWAWLPLSSTRNVTAFTILPSGAMWCSKETTSCG